MLFFWNFLLRVVQERNRTIIFIFSLSLRFPTYFGLKRSHNGVFQLFEFFCYFFWIFYFVSCRNGTERNDSFLLCIFLPILAWKEPIMVFFNFLNFFNVLLEFSIMCRVGLKRTDNFYFFSFLAFTDRFWLEMKP